MKNEENIKKEDVIKMLKEMQVEAVKCKGFVIGHVTQLWVVKDLLGKKIEELGGKPLVVKDGRLVDEEEE